jgi:heme/copper-type cytochrome/quinol oxidase subunit 2
MNSMNPRRAAGLGTIICALGMGSGFSLRGDAPPDRQDPSALAASGWTLQPTGSQSQEPATRSLKVTASRYRFDPPVLEVFQDDLVTVELRTEDIAHSLTIDAYRIAKRVSPAQPVTFEFRANQTGTFPYYCNLQIDDGCRQMRGQLVVKPHR